MGKVGADFIRVVAGIISIGIHLAALVGKFNQLTAGKKLL